MMREYLYGEFVKDVQTLKEPLVKENIDTVVAIARGGVSFGHFLSEMLDLRAFYTLNSNHYDGEVKKEDISVFNIPDLTRAKRVLLVDDISDSGDTLDTVVPLLKQKFPHIELVTVTLFYKTSSAFKPHYYLHEADEWISFFWDIDVK